MEELDLKEIFWIIWDKKKIVLAITAILVLIAAIYSFILQTPKYKSTTTVVLTMSEGENATAVTTTDVTLNQKLLGTYVDIVKRDMIIDKVIENLQIANLTSSQLKSDVTVSTKTDTYIIDITVSNENSEYAARIANEIGKVFSEEVSKMYKMNNIYILDSAKVNSTPYNVKPAKYIGIAFIAGIFISCAVIVIMNLFDTTVKSADEIEKALKVPVIAQLAFYDDTIKKGVNKR
jgi:capsular polysaccharide biosynthesis protein